MNEFKELIDRYFDNHSSFKNGNVLFECDLGELIFYKENNNVCVLRGIYIFPQYRKNGLCRYILKYIIDKCQGLYSYFCVESVISKILYMYLLRFTHNNKKFKLVKKGFLYKIK